MPGLDPYPLILLGVGTFTILVLIIYLRVNAFLALITAALLVGLLSPRVILDSDGTISREEFAVFAERFPAFQNNPDLVEAAFGRLDENGDGGLSAKEFEKVQEGLPEANVPAEVLTATALFEKVDDTRDRVALLEAPKQVMLAFGVMMGKIGLVIALATIIGKAMMDSGAAERIVRFFTDLFGERFGGLALLASGYVLSVPVFFDTVFLLLVPLAKALYKQTKKNYLLYVTAIGAGGAITHSLVPPTPGPVAMSATLKIDLGVTILMGLVVGIPLAGVGYLYASFANRMWPVTPRGPAAGTDGAPETAAEGPRPLHEMPSLGVALLPIVLPVLLITSSTLFNTFTAGDPDLGGFVVAGQLLTPGNLLAFVGEPAVALLISAVVSMWLVANKLGMTRRRLGTFTASALDDAGMILLITSAGGSFGAMLKEVGVGDSLRVLSGEFNLSLIVLAWIVAALFKIAQGSGTVSMITSSSILMAILLPEMGVSEQAVTTDMLAQHLGYHPIYLLLAIGCGSKIGSWMNDSGFWVVCKMGGLTEGETFRSWTVCLASMGVAGLPIVLLLARFFPLRELY